MFSWRYGWWLKFLDNGSSLKDFLPIRNLTLSSKDHSKCGKNYRSYNKGFKKTLPVLASVEPESSPPKRIVWLKKAFYIKSCCASQKMNYLLIKSKVEARVFYEIILMHVWNQELFQTFQFKWDVSYLKQFKSVCSTSPYLKPSLKPCILLVKGMVFLLKCSSLLQLLR